MAKGKKKKTKEAAWLSDLEARVRETAEAVRTLRQENSRLKKKLQSLEGGRGGSSGGEEEWEKERQQLRRRVEKLARGLEKLLEESH